MKRKSTLARSLKMILLLSLCLLKGMYGYSQLAAASCADSFYEAYYVPSSISDGTTTWTNPYTTYCCGTSSTGCSGTVCAFGDYTATTTFNATAGSNYALSFSLYDPCSVGIWVDWNNDGVFQTSEYMAGVPMTSANYGFSLNPSFFIPGYTAAGQYRMRVVSLYYYYSYYVDNNAAPGQASLATFSGNACGNWYSAANPAYNYSGYLGGWWDFTLNVINNYTCYPPQALVTTSVSGNGVNFTWSTPPASTPLGFQWIVLPSGGTPGVTTPVASAFVNGVTTTASASGLSSSTNYCIYVRSYCGNLSTDTSIWTLGTCFRTLSPPCSTAAAPVNITNTAFPASTRICLGATLTLNAVDPNTTVSGVIYHWATSTTGNPPFTMINSASFGGGATGFTTLNLTTFGMPLQDSISFTVFDSCTNVPGSGTHGNVYKVRIKYYTVPYSEDFYSTPNNAEPLCYKKDIDPQYGQFAVQHGYMSANGTNITANVCPFLNNCCNTPTLSEYFTIPALNLLPNTTYTVSFDYSRNNQNYQPHIQLYVNTADPGTTWTFGSPTVTNGTLILDSTVNFNEVRHATCTYFSGGGLSYFSWYTNTAEAQSIAYGTSIGISNVNVYIANPCVAPTVQATSLTLASNVNSVTGTFTPAANVNHYLVVRTNGTATVSSGYPQNGTNYTVGSTCGNGTVVAIAHTPAFTDLGLVANTQYTYTIFAVNDLCSGGPLYNTTSPLTGTISTTGPRTYVWNQTVQGDWTVASNWTPTRVNPDQSDILVFNNSVVDTAYNIPTQVISGLRVINNTTVRLWGATGSILSLASDGDSTTNELSINAGSTLYLDGTSNAFKINYSGTGATGLINGVLEMAENGPQNMFDFTGAKTTVSITGSLNEGGTSSITGITSQPYNLATNGTINFKYTTVTGPSLPFATWNTGSTMLISGYTTAAGAPGGASYSAFVGGFNQQFYNFTYNCPAQTSNSNWSGAMGPGTFNVQGTFTMTSTGTGSLTLAGTGQPFRSQVNNFVQTGGKLYISNSTSIGIYHFQVMGNVNLTGGIFGIDPSASTAVYSSTDFCLTFNGTTTQSVNMGINPVGTLTYRFINPNGINLTLSNGLTALRINPGGGIRISNLVNNPITTSAVVYDSIYTGAPFSIPNPQPTLLTYDSASAGSVISPVVWPALNGGSTGTQYGPLFVVINIGQNAAIKFPSGFNPTLSYTTGANTASGCGILKLIQGNLDIGNNTLTLGINAAAYGQLWAAPTSMINTVVNGTLKRWWTSNGMATSQAAANAGADARGYFPLAAGGAPRFVSVWGSTTTLTAGTMSVTHNPQTLLTTGLSIADGAYTIQSRTNANWTVATGGAYAFAGTYNMRLSAGNLFFSATPSNLRVMTQTGVVGTHVAGGSLTITNNPLPYYYAQRSALTTAQLTGQAWYIGANANDINVNNIWTAINTGAWNNASTWDVGTVPPATAYCYINSGVNVTAGSASDVGKYLVNNGTLTISNPNTRLTIDSFLYNNGTINISGGTNDSLVVNGSYTVNPTLAIPTNNYGILNISGGVLRVGPVGGGKVPFQNYGNVNVSGGMFALNGNLNLSLVATNYFIQTGGTIRVDGNAGGVTANSVSVPLINFGSFGVLNSSFTGGTLIIVDPSAQSYTGSYTSGNAVDVINYTGATYQNNMVPPHTLQFGDGISQDPGGSPTLGFYIYTNSGPYLSFSNIVVNGGKPSTSAYGTNRFVSWYYYLNVFGNITVMPYGELSGTYYAGHYGPSPTSYLTYSFYLIANDSITVMLNGKAEFSYLYFGTYRFGNPYVAPPTYHQAFINYNPVTAPNIWDGYYNGSNYWPTYISSVSAGMRIPSSYYMYFFSAQPIFLGNIAVGYYNYLAPISVISGNSAYNNQPSIITAPASFNGAFNAVVEPANSSMSYTPSQTYGWVNGFYQKHATTGGIGHRYWVGDSAWFTEVDLTNLPGQTAVTQQGDIAVKSTAGLHPNIATSGLNPVKSLKRYFSILPVPNTVSNMNITFNANSMFGTFNWVAGDVPLGALNYAFVPARDSSGVFASPSTLHWFSSPNNLPGPVIGNIGSGVGVIKNMGNPVGDYTFGETCPKTNISAQPTALNICSNIPASFSVSAGGLGLSFQWYKNGIALSNGGNISGATSSTLNLASATASDTGCYYVTITSTCDVPLTSNTACLQITQAALITSTQVTTTLCVGGNATFNVSAIGQAPLTYKWYKNGILQSQWNNQTSITISNANVTNSAVYTATATNSCRTDSTNPGDTLNVNPAPPAVITPQGPATFCLGDSVLFIADSGVGYTYTWHYNGSIVAANNTPYLTAYNAGGYYLSVQDANGCTATSSTDSVTTLAAPTAAVTHVGSLSFCQGGNVVLNSTQAAGYVYQWQVDTGTGFYNISGAVASTYTANTHGNYRVKITNTGGCSTISNVDTVVVNTPPVVTSTAIGPTTFCQGGSVILQTNPTNVTYTYNWKNNGVNVGNASSYNANAAGSYTDSVTDVNGCHTTTSAIVVTVNSLPFANATALSTTSLCPGGSVVLEANAGAGLTYQWRKNTINIGGATNISYTATTAGTYDVVVSNTNGCSTTSSSITVTINVANANITPNPSNSTVCQGNAVALIESACGACTHQWYENSPNGYVPITGATAANYNATVQGSYHVVVTNGTGCTATSSNDSVTVLPLPTAGATAIGATSFCAGGSVNLVASPYNPSVYSYQWYQNGTLMAATSDTISVNTTAAYYVIVTNIVGGCFATSNTINVNALPNPSPAISASGSLSICTGQTVTLNGSPLGAYTYQWYEDTGSGYFAINGATSANYNAGATGNYEVVVTTTGANCTGTSAPEAVFVNPVPYESPSGPTEFCFGSNVTLYTHAGTGANLSYAWYKMVNGVAVAVGNTYPFYNVYQSGQYFCLVSVLGSCSQPSDTITIVQDSLPIAYVTYAGGQLTTNAYNHYQWYVNNTLIAGATNQSITPTVSGDYKVLVTNGKGCSAYSNVYHWGNTGVVNVAGGIDVTIYPNPATSYIHIEAAVKVNVFISSLEGKVVMHQDDATIMDLNQLANGVYMIKVYSQDGALLKVDKLVKNGN